MFVRRLLTRESSEVVPRKVEEDEGREGSECIGEEANKVVYQEVKVGEGLAGAEGGTGEGGVNEVLVEGDVGHCTGPLLLLVPEMGYTCDQSRPVAAAWLELRPMVKDLTIGEIGEEKTEREKDEARGAVEPESAVLQEGEMAAGGGHSFQKNGGRGHVGPAVNLITSPALTT